MTVQLMKKLKMIKIF